MDDSLDKVEDFKPYIEILELAQDNLICQLQLQNRYQLLPETIPYDHDKSSIQELLQGIEAFKNIANNCGASTSSGEFNFDDFYKELRMLQDGIQMLKALQRKIDLLKFQDQSILSNINFPKVIYRC